MLEGRVKKLASRGFGFIETKDEIDFFFHYTDFQGLWKELLSNYVTGNIITVSFDVDTENGKSGPKAKNVKIISNLRHPLV